MGEKIVVGPITKGLQTNVLPFNVDNDAFPVLINAQSFRGRIRRRRGDTTIGRLTRYFDSTDAQFNRGTGTTTSITLDGNGEGNLLTGFTDSDLESTAQLKSNTIELTATSNFYLDDNAGNFYSGKLITGASKANPCEITSASHGLTTGTNVKIVNVQGMTQLNNITYTITSTGTNTFTLDGIDSTGFSTYTSGGAWVNVDSTSDSVNYATGVISISAEANNSVTAIFKYYPNLPALGIREFNPSSSQFQGNLLFDTTYSYNLQTSSPFTIHDVSFFWNPSSPVSKSDLTPVTWNGNNYQQFWTINYADALWATNTVPVPYSGSNIGMPFKTITAVTNVNGTTADLAISAHGLVNGDWVYVNELETVTGMNFQVGYVTDASNANTVRVVFPNATIAGTQGSLTGVCQYLTNRPDKTKDCLRYYTGSPISSASPPVTSTSGGWVNYCPPVSLSSYGVADLTLAQYYLVHAKLIIPFKDHLLFLGPVVQTRTGSPVYLQDTIIYSQNGTPYYTASWAYSSVNPTAGDLVSSSFTSYLTPSNQNATPSAMFEDISGFGGYISAGFDEAITTVSSNDDVLILGFDQQTHARLYFTADITLPFVFYVITNEYGAESTFSAINFDEGIISVGTQGMIVTNQTTSQRIDIPIPDEIFQFKRAGNGMQRVSSARDYINEWAYFSFPTTENENVFPTRTLFYNYRNTTWAIYEENFTCYGTLRQQSGATWDELTEFTWDEWTDPWDSGENSLFAPEILGGNAQGYIQKRAEGVGEDVSGYISGISGSVVTASNHSLETNDYIVIKNALGTNIKDEVNGKVFSVRYIDENSFNITPTTTATDYIGNGEFERIYRPFIQTRQFPISWGLSRQTRLGPQQYLFTNSPSGEVTINVYLSQDGATSHTFPNTTPTLPNNPALVNTNILSLAPDDDNLQTPNATNAGQIWHRVTNGLIGSTVQIGITLSDDQLEDPDLKKQFAEIELHGFILDVFPSRFLA